MQRKLELAPGLRCADQGAIGEPVLLCGGAYGNLEALQALLAAARALGIPPRRIVHTGDVVAYCADPAATAALLRSSGALAIKGNVEQSLALRHADCGCGFEPDTACNALSEQWFAYADARIDQGLRTWMAGLPDHLTFVMGGLRVRVVHGGVGAVNAYRFASDTDAVLAEEFAAGEADVILAGHCGIPFTRRAGDRVWHNSGSLGMPANDGTPRVWYSLITPRAGGIHFAHFSLDYDHAQARAEMLAAGLPRGYAEALASGLWPSLSVLPEMERRATGRPLAPPPMLLTPTAGQNGRAGPSEATNSVEPTTMSAIDPPSAVAL